jgi:hypothetical protein
LFAVGKMLEPRDWNVAAATVLSNAGILPRASGERAVVVDDFVVEIDGKEGRETLAARDLQGQRTQLLLGYLAAPPTKPSPLVDPIANGVVRRYCETENHGGKTGWLEFAKGRGDEKRAWFDCAQDGRPRVVVSQ